MIGWIALAVAANASSTANNAQKTAEQAQHNTQTYNPMVIIKPFHLEKKYTNTSFWFMRESPKRVLAKEPFATFSIKRSDILNLCQSKDDEGTPFVRLDISEYANLKDDDDSVWIGLLVPGTVEEIAGIIGGV